MFDIKQKGTYILLLKVCIPTRLAIGRLGTFLFPQGFYAYVGSAFGPGGLKARIAHHVKVALRPHWHIDYLRKNAIPLEILYSTQTKSLEHRWASILGNIHPFIPFIPEFGASDCQCKTHLFYSQTYPALSKLAHDLSATLFPESLG